jgi:hypothetical protein
MTTLRVFLFLLLTSNSLFSFSAGDATQDDGGSPDPYSLDDLCPDGYSGEYSFGSSYTVTGSEIGDAKSSILASRPNTGDEVVGVQCTLLYGETQRCVGVALPSDECLDDGNPNTGVPNSSGNPNGPNSPDPTNPDPEGGGNPANPDPTNPDPEGGGNPANPDPTNPDPEGGNPDNSNPEPDSSCITGNADNPSTLDYNECTGRYIDNSIEGETEREQNERRCGIGQQMTTSGCKPIPDNCGYVNNQYGCWDNSQTNCGSYTNSLGQLVEGCFDPEYNIQDPDSNPTNPTDPNPTDPNPTDPNPTDPNPTDPNSEIDLSSITSRLDSINNSVRSSDSNNVNSVNRVNESIKQLHNESVSVLNEINNQLESNAQSDSNNVNIDYTSALDSIKNSIDTSSDKNETSLDKVIEAVKGLEDCPEGDTSDDCAEPLECPEGEHQEGNSCVITPIDCERGFIQDGKECKPAPDLDCSNSGPNGELYVFDRSSYSCVKKNDCDTSSADYLSCLKGFSSAPTTGFTAEDKQAVLDELELLKEEYTTLTDGFMAELSDKVSLTFSGSSASALFNNYQDIKGVQVNFGSKIFLEVLEYLPPIIIFLATLQAIYILLGNRK